MQLDNKQINFIQDRANERIIEIFEALDIDYIENGDYIQSACPVHEGDNPRALYWATQSCHWKCMTHHCEQDESTGGSTSVFGLVRGTLFARTGKKCSFREAINFVSGVLGINNNAIDNSSLSDRDFELQKIVKQYKSRIRQNISDVNLQHLSTVVPLLKPDTTYYPKRGVSQGIIDKYHISICLDQTKPFKNRAFFPILDESGKYVMGWSGRSIYGECNECHLYHHAKVSCPSKEYFGIYAKWRHSKNLSKEKCLYNFSFAKIHIGKEQTAIICEGPGDVWSLETAGIKNSVAIFGLSISKQQRKLLQKAGALTLYIVLDSDIPGQEAIERIKKNLMYYFQLKFISLDKHDLGEMKPEEIYKLEIN